MILNLSRTARYAVALAAALLAGATPSPRAVLAEDPASSPERTALAFATPNEAIQALVDACDKNDDKALLALCGAGSGDLVAEGADPRVAKERKAFADAAKAKVAFLPSADDPSVVEVDVGEDGWPAPFPVVKGEDGRWRLDSAAAREEMLRRRIGADELAAIDVCRDYLDAQVDYASEDRDGDGVREYAQRLRSTPGQEDGLSWPSDAAQGEAPSPFDDAVTPLHDFLAGAAQEPPFTGYCYEILTAQGAHAPGGAHSYVINGNMIAGFALVAVPAEYGRSGVMTFLLSHHGKLFQKDLGEQSLEVVKGMAEFDPDSTWTEVKPGDEVPAAEK